MKWIVVSDSHYLTDRLDEILLKYPKAQGYIHCGDVEDYEQNVRSFLCVKGNNDYFASFPENRIVQLNNQFQAYVTHSHRFSPTVRHEQLARRAKETNCNVVFYGHTHVPFIGKVDGVWIVNPGSIWHNRVPGGPTYAVVDIEENEIKFEILSF